MLASPHAFGSMLKTNYITHIAAAFGNVITIEGVTCFSDQIEFGDYKISNGKIKFLIILQILINYNTL